RTSPTVMRRCPATGRRTTSTSRWRARWVSTSCSPTGCARWRSAQHRLLGLLGVEHPARVWRIAVRFAAPTPMDSELTVNAFGIKENSFAFEAAVNGTTTITDGRLELRP